jgi:dolichol-phosphate mannosyltransferase
MKLSVVIPAYNEEGCIEGTVRALYQTLKSENIEHEILVINDNSKDSTLSILTALRADIETLRFITNPGPNGFGMAVRKGLENFEGDAVAVYMADASDRPEDLVRYYRAMESEGVDCVFGTRFSKQSRVYDYPKFKLVINRFANKLIQYLFRLDYNDTTNAFKLYRSHTIQGVKPFLAHHFNLTVEIPLKAMIRGYSFAVVPNDWINRKTGESKLKIKEMGSRYLFIMLYCLIEKLFSMGDYQSPAKRAAMRAALSSPLPPVNALKVKPFSLSEQSIATGSLAGKESVKHGSSLWDRLKNPRAISVLNVLQICIWTILALSILPTNGHFLYDEAFFYNEAMRTAKGEIFPVLGPYISGSTPQAYTPGGAVYLIYSLPFLFATNPAAGTAWVILLSAFSILVLDRVLKKINCDLILRFFAITFMTWNYWHFLYLDRIWNVHLFSAVSVLLLSLTLLAVGLRKLSLVMACGFGMLSALAVQIHMGGLLAVSICGVLLLTYLRKIGWFRILALMAAGFIIPYVPFIVSEISGNTQNIAAMMEVASAKHPPSLDAIKAALAAPFLYSSHVKSLVDANNFSGLSLIQSLTFYGAIALILAGALQKNFFRRMALLSIFVLPLYFYLNKREYHDHYVAALMPYFAILPALGAAALFKRNAFLRSIILAYAVIFALGGGLLAVREYRSKPVEVTAKGQIEEAKSIVKNDSVQVINPNTHDTRAFRLWVLAKNVLGKDINFINSETQKPCQVQIGRAPNNAEVYKIDQGSYFVCF